VSEQLDCIVLTGAAGRLGSTLRPRLASLCKHLRLLDSVRIENTQPNETAFKLDLNDADALMAALSGCDAVVHFAGYPREADWNTLLAANITGVISLWDTALRAGVSRMIYASSNHAVGLYDRQKRLNEDVPPRPDSRYGVTKVFMESVAALYAVKHGMKGFGIRIGHSAPEPSDARMLSHWIHPEDLAALVKIGLQADYECEIVYGASANTQSWWINQRAGELGYKPRHSADTFAQLLVDKRSNDPIAEYFQGGSFASDGFTNARFSNH
jgi:uronate dehydrogenase